MGQIADRMQAQAQRTRESILEAFKPRLEPGEELRFTCTVTQFRAPAVVRFLFSWSLLLPIFGPTIALFLSRTWFVGITQGRALLTPMKRGSATADASGVVAVPLGDVTMVRNGKKAKVLVANAVGRLPKSFAAAKPADLDKLQEMLQT